MSDQRSYHAIIVGGGIAGLTAASYLSASGHQVLLIEQASVLGGNITSFFHQGHIIDGGIRSIENSGVLKPMIKDLGLDVTLLKSPVTLGIEDNIIPMSSALDIDAYQQLLIDLFPKDETDIRRIIKRILKILTYMDVLYGIDNPMIIDLKKQRSYVFKTLLPWFFKFVPTLFQITRLNGPVEDYLRRYTHNQALIDMIAQHFFKATPTFFALGYFAIYFDYHYPKGGTKQLIDALETHILQHGGSIQKNTRITKVMVDQHQIKDTTGQIYHYQNLIWACDLKSLYQQLDGLANLSKRQQTNIEKQQALLMDKTGAESVLTVYATVNLSPSVFQNITSGHVFYTPKKAGLKSLRKDMPKTRDALFDWYRTQLDHQTYEISIPSLRDPDLSPEGETALIISVLMPYDQIKEIQALGFYDDFKSMVETHMISVLSKSLYPNLSDHVLSVFSSTPLTFKERTLSTDGAIIGWAYDNKPIPVLHTMSKITNAIKTPLPDIYQAGQWSFSPAGVPISILTGKLSADRVKKQIKKTSRR
jgi:phytoene dehydrogenase-like protein